MKGGTAVQRAEIRVAYANAPAVSITERPKTYEGRVSVAPRLAAVQPSSVPIPVYDPTQRCMLALNNGCVIKQGLLMSECDHLWVGLLEHSGSEKKYSDSIRFDSAHHCRIGV